MSGVVRRLDCSSSPSDEEGLYWIDPIGLLDCGKDRILELASRFKIMLYGSMTVPYEQLMDAFRFIAIPFFGIGVLEGLGIPSEKLIVITTPAIVDDAGLREMGFTLPADSITMKQSASAMKMGAAGVVIRSALASRIRRTFGKRLLIMARGRGEGEVDYWIEP